MVQLLAPGFTLIDTDWLPPSWDRLGGVQWLMRERGRLTVKLQCFLWSDCGNFCFVSLHVPPMSV